MSEQYNNPQVILELTVRNHPGVMSHVCGLFARRAFNVEGILCLPLKDGKQSRIWLLVADDQRLMQMISQVEKLEDVLQVKRHSEDVRVFEQLEAFFQ
ncbi:MULTISPECIES: acetolactate synthase small subunit [Serratia]|jgi:acetolactate synthase-1/3 small subunit|uniref:acetolactate synthase n=1 Tax=Serratia grimesii TaxID=82995 RepID=A0A7G2JGQ2_9GAMM|nr:MULTISPECIES: acetolactate synthase small subunit [Serratia]KFB88528.1 acetolactate synthase [Serratia grimesii]MBP1130651.1 acetolactate synthase-1/3 small subunit [Serratia sp. PL17]CAI0979131.1 Acetolactate synthase isozyme 1 small subunit [Serratia grimesii]CAI1072074.1 Acetolactate synthase isozyme 1 small subunit [Serratia grimesii]CAI1818386.1 Acetolactate synthase isozyme 1 small subunit [Serratia grimesii]